MMNIGDNPHLHKTDVSRSTLFWADCFDVFPFIEDKSIDAIICDLPYGTTILNWDKILPITELWKHYNRILDRKSTRLNSSHLKLSRMPSSA